MVAMAPAGSELPLHARLAATAAERLRSACKRAGFTIEPADAGDGALALRARRRPRSFVLVVRAAREVRRDHLTGFFADALLRARGLATGSEHPVAVLAVPVLTRATAELLRAYAERFAAGASWILLDATGRADVRASGLEGLELEARDRRPPVATRRRIDPFTDLHQWLLKVLLAPSFPEEQLSAPRQRFDTAVALARAARVSVPVTTRFLQALREDGFVDESRGPSLVDRERLLDRWRTAVAARPVEELRARFVLPRSDARKQLHAAVLAWVGRRAASESAASWWNDARMAPGSRLCLGLFAGAALHGVGHVHGVPDHLLVERLTPAALEELGLREASTGEAVQVVVRRARFPEATFRAAPIVRGLPVADVLQCWLDVGTERARGGEQAELLWRRVLAPRLGDPT